MELLDIVDENGTPTGETVERTFAHAQGIRHRTSHVWVLRTVNGKTEILLQKRSRNKDSYPGCYDISSAGHIPAGVDWIPSAVRELREELGVSVDGSRLIDCGIRRFSHSEVFHGKPFLDCQVSRIFALWLEDDEQSFTLQKSEVESVLWMEFHACRKAILDGSIPACVFPGELDMVEHGAMKS